MRIMIKTILRSEIYSMWVTVCFQEVNPLANKPKMRITSSDSMAHGFKSV